VYKKCNTGDIVKGREDNATTDDTAMNAANGAWESARDTLAGHYKVAGYAGRLKANAIAADAAQEGLIAADLITKDDASGEKDTANNEVTAP